MGALSTFYHFTLITMPREQVSSWTGDQALQLVLNAPSHQLKILSCHRRTAHPKLTQTRLFSVLQAQRQRVSQDCTKAQVVSSSSQNHCCGVCSRHTVIPKVDKGTADRGKRGRKSRKHGQGYPQVSTKARVCENRSMLNEDWGL